MIGKTNTDRYMDIYINGDVKVAVILKKNMCFFSCSKPLQAHVQYIFNESVKYQNLSTNSSSPVYFTMHVLSQLHHPRAYKTQ